jgi:single-strand DNA-binding protein
MTSINTCTFSGRLGDNPELKYFEAGSCVAEFSLAIDNYNSEKKTKKTMWLDIKAWAAKAEFVGEHLKKGDKIFVSGFMDYRSWTDENGTKHKKYFIVANQIEKAEWDKKEEEVD